MAGVEGTGQSPSRSHTGYSKIDHRVRVGPHEQRSCPLPNPLSQQGSKTSSHLSSSWRHPEMHHIGPGAMPVAWPPPLKPPTITARRMPPPPPPPPPQPARPPHGLLPPSPEAAVVGPPPTHAHEGDHRCPLGGGRGWSGPSTQERPPPGLAGGQPYKRTSPPIPPPKHPRRHDKLEAGLQPTARRG